MDKGIFFKLISPGPNLTEQHLPGELISAAVMKSPGLFLLNASNDPPSTTSQKATVKTSTKWMIAALKREDLSLWTLMISGGKYFF